LRYGTVARLQPKAGEQAESLALITDWKRQRKSKVPDAKAAYLLNYDDQSSSPRMVMAFADQSSYLTDANDPEQDHWYRRMHALLDFNPIWQDGETSA
jgi:hypothetical protein